jgi:hypothetical protein
MASRVSSTIEYEIEAIGRAHFGRLLDATLSSQREHYCRIVAIITRGEARSFLMSNAIHINIKRPAP